jgi:hypothetical protein
MIRMGTLVCLLLALGAGIGMFHLKYEVQALEKVVTGLHRSLIAERNAIHVLEAEWSLLNDPGRLSDLNRRHLGLVPVTADRLVRIEDLPLPLPPAAVLPGPEAASSGAAVVSGVTFKP